MSQRGSLAWLRGIVLMVRRPGCCSCRAERDMALIEVARLRERVRIAEWDAVVPIRELREEIARLRDRSDPG